MIVTLDLNSHRCGIAAGGPADKAPRVLSWNLFGKEDEDTLARSLAALYSSISDLCKLLHPKFVYYEAPFNPQDARGKTNAQAIRSGLSLAAIAMAAGRNAGAITKPISTQTWRKTFCGHGRPEDPKAATVARCKMFGWSVANDDEADAAGMWMHAMLIHYPQWVPNSVPLFAGRGAA